MCSGVYFENDVLVFPNGYAMRNKLRQNLVDKPGKSDILNTEEKKPWNYSFVFTRFFRKLRLDKTNIYDSDLLDNVKRTDFYEILIYGADVIGGKQHEKRRIQKTVNC